MWNSGFMMLDWTVVQKRFFVVGFKLRLFCWTYVGAAVWNLATGWDGTLVFKFGGCSGWKSDSGKHLKSMHIWDSANLKLMRTHIPRSVAHKVTVQPPVEQFADMLEALFHGTPIESQQPDDLNETPWTMAELEVAIAKLNCKKCADGAGLVAELLKNAPEEILKVLLALFNEILSLGAVPVEWSKTLFIMLSKKPGAVQPTDFRPIAIVRLLYKTFAYLILGRIEGPLDAHQPEEQHGFRSNYRVEEHLLPVTRPHYMVCRYGSSVWTCPKPLIACLGQRCGAAKAFFANRWVLCDKIKNVSLGARLRFFQSVVTPVACFASGYRTVRSQDLQAMNVEFRTLLRSIVGPPQNIVWEAPWHEVLHEWNERARRLEDRHCVLDWGFVALRHYWKLARYVAHLPEDRWVRRLLDWKPCGRKKVGRPFFTWESKLEEFCRHKYLGPWQSAASDLDFWHGLMDDFVRFCL
eukprot:s314_g27.t1